MALSETIEPEKVSRGKRGTRPPLGKTFGLRESRYYTCIHGARVLCRVPSIFVEKYRDL
jgi:hypothetical protein